MDGRGGSHVDRFVCPDIPLLISQVAKLYEIEALSASGKTRGSKHLINWKLAQEALGRKSVDCRHKWQSLQNSKLKKGMGHREAI